MKAAVLREYGKFVWETRPEPKAGPGEILIRVSYASICGSDQHIFCGEFHPRTRLPLIPGHEFCGEVVSCGTGVTSVATGDRVAVDPIMWCGQCAACLIGHYPACKNLRLLGVDQDGGFGQYVVAAENMVYKLSESISSQHGALVELYAIGFHANNRAGTVKDDIIAIWGGGKVGHSILQAARIRTKNTIFVIDLIDRRLEIAAQNYANVRTINALREDPIKVIQAETDNRGVDIAFESVGHARQIKGQPAPVHGCIQIIRGAGTVCVLGLSNEFVPILMKDLIWREAKIVASRNSHGEFAEVITALAHKKLSPEALITGTMAAAEAQSAFETLKQNPDKHLKILLELNS